MWKKGPSRCVQRILSDQLELEEGVPQEIMEPFWKAIFSVNTGLAPTLKKETPDMDRLWYPIKAAEIRSAFPTMSTAAGPDRVTAKTLRETNISVLEIIFNLFLYSNGVPEYLYESRTILLPKKKGAREPENFRPITVSSVILRTFRKVLANRLKAVSLDKRQRGFISTEGGTDNTVLLDLILRFHRERFKSMFMASLDMRKAFDSVTFETIEEVLESKGIPEPMIDYILKMYNVSTTVLQHAGWKSARIHPRCGVKQGDPLSSYIFNFVIDELLKRIPPEIGVDIDGTKVNVLAFADDLVLVASTEVGLQKLIDTTADFLYTCGLEANAGKCVTIAMRNVPKQKKTVIDQKCSFNIRGTKMYALKRSDDWKYLGLHFTPEGRAIVEVRGQLDHKIGLITKAPLKPQQ